MDTDMGDRHGGGDSRAPARDDTSDDTSSTGRLWRALGRALRAEALDPPAEQRARAAYRAARDSGIHQRADTRKQDDWRGRDD